MKALILNSGTGQRMGAATQNQPKCMTQLENGQTLLARQLQLLQGAGVEDILITTGPFRLALEEHARQAAPKARLAFVNNPGYADTNYIHSIWLARDQLEDDILLLHGDLVFNAAVLAGLLALPHSAMATSSTQPLPEKDFKAVVDGGRITAVGIEFFDSAVAAQPLYRLLKADWLIWLEAIGAFEARGEVRCYAENALNAVSDRCRILPYDVKDALCAEVDTPEDLAKMNRLLAKE